MRRTIALLLLILTALTSVEVAEGMARDGEVHHESSATAVAHAAGPSGEHGHEDAGATSEDSEAPDHGPDHQHGTGADHCTHVHGPAISIGGTAMAVTMIGAADLRGDAGVPTEHIRSPRHEPPRT